MDENPNGQNPEWAKFQMYEIQTCKCQQFSSRFVYTISAIRCSTAYLKFRHKLVIIYTVKMADKKKKVLGQGSWQNIIKATLWAKY